MKKIFIIKRTVYLLISIFLLAIVFSGCQKPDELKNDNTLSSTLSSKNTLKAAILNSPQIIIDDMTLAPDAPLHGTEALSWGLGEASPQPMPCPAKNFKGEWWQAMTAWGQVYIPRSGSTATNTRCQIRNVTTKLLRNNGTWETVQSGAFGGSAYVEDFANNSNKDAGARDESSNEGGLSVIVGVGAWAGYNYHFYTNGRAFVDVNNCVGVFTTCEARLIKSDVNGVDDRANCKNILQMGADWWLNTTTGWLPDWSANSGIGGMRSKWVTSDWQSYSFCSLTPAQINANPPVAGGGTYTTIPAEIEAEAYSSMYGVATETTTDTGGGLDVGWTDAGDYMNYNIHVNSAGTFTVDLRVASANGGGSLQLKSGSTVLATVTVPNTGGWQTWTTVNSGNISLGAGDQVIQVYAVAGGWNINWLQFNTGGASAPTVSTTTPSSITQTTASSGGNVTADGGASVTARGVCWSTSSNPTTSNSKTSDGTGTGTFTSSITGLTASTTYHVRAYATNSVGTSYGSDQQFTTSSSGGALSKTGWTATATTQNSGNAPGLVIDGNNATEYLSNGFTWSADNYTIDMKSNQTFTKIIRKVDGAYYPHGWTIYVSTDNVNWGTAIASGTCSNGNDITSTFSSKTARYIKVVLSANQANYWGEFEATVY